MTTPQLSRRERLSLACAAARGAFAGATRAIVDWVLTEIFD